MQNEQVVMSWGRVLKQPHTLLAVGNRHAPLLVPSELPHALPFGNGRSYGDSNLNPQGGLLMAGIRYCVGRRRMRSLSETETTDGCLIRVSN